MKKVLIIKLGGLGDVVRTLPLAKAIKESYDAEIIWVTRNNAVDLLKNHPSINIVYSLENCGEIMDKNFDVLYNFDGEDEATMLAAKIKAGKKYGFYSDGGFVSAFNLGAEYYLNTLFDDEIKKTNKKTYQEMMFMSAELQYRRQHSSLFPSNKDRKYAEDFVKKNKITTEKLIGIHMGADSRWPSKVWHENNLKEFIKLAEKENYQIILFAGPNETEEQKILKKELDESNIKVYANNPGNSFMEFVSLVKLCKAMICSDSFALHVSLAMKKPTIGLFFCTSPNEIEDYGLLKKIASPLLYNFFPEKMNVYNEKLVKSISPCEVLDALMKLENKNK
ncbi:MAG: glycosyltransferase family 9 protein [Nanoarchaeota archaeon]